MSATLAMRGPCVTPIPLMVVLFAPVPLVLLVVPAIRIWMSVPLVRFLRTFYVLRFQSVTVPNIYKVIDHLPSDDRCKPL